eukprot:5950340-Alexandrium_andersonii.AAC.1
MRAQRAACCRQVGAPTTPSAAASPPMDTQADTRAEEAAAAPSQGSEYQASQDPYQLADPPEPSPLTIDSSDSSQKTMKDDDDD